jgi:hypothetical protein
MIVEWAVTATVICATTLGGWQACDGEFVSTQKETTAVIRRVESTRLMSSCAELPGTNESFTASTLVTSGQDDEAQARWVQENDERFKIFEALESAPEEARKRFVSRRRPA